MELIRQEKYSSSTLQPTTARYFVLIVVQILRMQLSQLATRLEQEQNCELCFVDGLIETECHKDMEGMSRGPYYTWCSMSPDNKYIDHDTAEQALNFVYDIIVEDGPFDGIMGFSQGANLALTLLRRFPIDQAWDSALASCKFGIFFSSVGVQEEQKDLATLSIPSLHVFDDADSNVPMLATRHCEPGSVKTLLHHSGHAIPRDRATVDSILEAIQDLQHRSLGI